MFSWDDRFKTASAAKRREQQGAQESWKITKNNIVEAKYIEPTTYLQRLGYTVKIRNGRLIAMIGQDERLRIQIGENGYIWCSSDDMSGGDNIDLVQWHEPGTSFARAVHMLNGTLPSCVTPRFTRSSSAPSPKLPGVADEAMGIDYLRRRGISLKTIKFALSVGAVTFAEGSVLFVGRDADGTVKAVTKRATNPLAVKPKSDFYGSDKAYPVIIPGVNDYIWIVEGGIDALACIDTFTRAGLPEPTVIVSGGSNVRKFLDTQHVRSIVKSAQSITIAREWEKSEKVQAAVDLEHAKLAEKISGIADTTRIKVYFPPRQFKDIGEENAHFSTMTKHACLLNFL
jgi:hypothetical protein